MQVIFLITGECKRPHLLAGGTPPRLLPSAVKAGGGTPPLGFDASASRGVYIRSCPGHIPLHRSNLNSCRFFANFRENFRIFSDFCKILLNFCEISAKINKILTQICKISEIRMVQKDANLVDFEKCCKMRLFSLS